jgi:hypothetical protein
MPHKIGGRKGDHLKETRNTHGKRVREKILGDRKRVYLNGTITHGPADRTMQAV